MTVPVLHALVKQYPDLQITIVSREAFRPFFEKLPANISFIAADLYGKHKGIRGLYRLFRELSPSKFDAVADLHDVLRTFFLRFCFRLTGIPVEHINKGRKEKKALTRQQNKKCIALTPTCERYANVCRTEGVPDFGNRRLVVFELTQIKQDKFLSDLVMALIFDVIHDKILSDRTRRGMIIFDEYAETAQMKSRGEDISIHSAVAFCYQKIRKENGAVMTIVQSPDQLPDDEFTKGMITNTQLLYILPTTDVVYRAVEKRFEMGGDPAQCNMMRSIRNDFSGERPHSECFIRFTGGQGRYAVVVRNELSREKFLAFQTDGETWAEIDGYSRTMPMEEAIGRYMERHPSKDRK